MASVRSERQVADFVDDEQGWPQVGLELAVELCMPGTGVPSSESKRPGHGVWDTALRQYCEARLARVQREAQVTWRQAFAHWGVG